MHLQIFLYGIICMSVFNTLCFGLSLDLNKVKEFLKKPLSPSIGLACQFILMPTVRSATYMSLLNISLKIRAILGFFLCQGFFLAYGTQNCQQQPAKLSVEEQTWFGFNMKCRPLWSNTLAAHTSICLIIYF